MKYFHILSLLGANWLLFRALYSVKVRTGFLEKHTPVRSWGKRECRIDGAFFADFDACSGLLRPSSRQKTSFPEISAVFRSTAFTPDWFANPFSNHPASRIENPRNWSRIPDFSAGDIKGVRELGRFAWVYPLIGAYVQTGDNACAKSGKRLLDAQAKTLIYADRSFVPSTRRLE